MSTIIYLLQVTACTAVFYLFYFLFLSRLTFFTTNRWYLLATVLLSFLIPVLRVTLSEQQPYVAAVQHIIYVPEATAQDVQPVIQQVPVAADPIHWDVILRMIYFAMAAALGVHLLITLLSFLKHIKGKRIAKIGKVNVLSGQQKIANGSFLNYIFLNDEELSADELQQIIAHEMLHIKLYHSADRILVKIAQIVLWFNPFIYLYARSVEENHEFEVDREIARSTDKHNYANLLLHLSVAGQGMLYHNFSKVPLKKRIGMLFNKPSGKMKRIVYILIVPVTLVSCLAFARFKKADATHRKSQKEMVADLQKQHAAEIKKQKEFDTWRKTDDYKKKDKLTRDIHNAGLITVNVKQKVNDQLADPIKQGFVVNYNNHDYFISTKYGQQKQLNDLLNVGDKLQMKVFSSGYTKEEAIVGISPAFIIKNNKTIFQLAEAAPISKQPFLSEANNVHYVDGQIANIEKYPDGKWKSAVVEEVNGYKFYLKFKPNAPNFSSIKDADHVRMRFVNEVARGYKEYIVSNWIAISTGNDYGIKNPELFDRYYTEAQKADVSVTQYSAVGDISKLGKNPLVTIDGKVYTKDILYTISPTCIKSVNIFGPNPTLNKHGVTIKDGYVDIKTKAGKIFSLTSSEKENISKEKSIPENQYYTRLRLKNKDGGYYDKAIISLPSGVGMSHDLSLTDKVGFLIDKKLYSEKEFKKILPSVINSFTGESGTGSAKDRGVNHGVNASAYNVIFYFNTKEKEANPTNKKSSVDGTDRRQMEKEQMDDRPRGNATETVTIYREPI